MILNYNNYISEKVIYDLLLESKLVYSKRFISFLNKMGSNKIAQTLSRLYTNDIPLTYNFVDTTDDRDVVSFTPDRKVQEIENSKETDIYVVVDNGRYLTNSDGNNRIYNLLEYTKKPEVWIPQTGTQGKILKEVISPTTGSTYVWFRGIGDYADRETVLNKEAVAVSNDVSNIIWTSSRNNIKIGRLVRAILTSAKVPFSDKDIEDFVNVYKSTYDIMANALIRFDIVSGSDIPHWYSHKNYAEVEGVLGNSCMSDVNEDFFDIYASNKNCRMIILYDENGQLGDTTGQLDLFGKNNQKYKSDKIIGRCLLWKTTRGIEIMDRIYTINDSDVNLFKEFGKKNGFYWKRCQDSDNMFVMENGTTSEQAVSLTIKLEECDFEYYPYLDTFYYLDTDNSVLTNDNDNPHDRYLRDTDGGWDTD